MFDGLLHRVRLILVAIRAVAGVLLVLSVSLNFANIIGRYFFSVSIPWAEEAMLFLMVGCVFLGSAPVTWAGRHIRMDVIVSMMPAPVRDALEVLSDLAFVTTAVIIVVFAWPVITQLAAFDERSQAANFPLVIPQAIVPIGLSLMALLVAIRLVVQLWSRRPGAGGAQP
jgi:C4-dicarboxylate transporter, DctQ subunit